MRQSPAPDAQREHPLTGQLVGSMRRGTGGLKFEKTDIERLRNIGAKLVPEKLRDWLRELNVLAVTLRNDLVAAPAASQLERELIDPLCAMLDHRQAS
jgi:hypothetical protein